MYSLMFYGELVTGCERVDVVAKLALLLKQPEARVETLLFDAASRKIKRVDTFAQAQQWQAAFAKAGAVLSIEQELAKTVVTPDIIPEVTSQPAIPPDVEKNFPLVRKSAVKKTWLKWSAICLIGLLLASAAFLSFQREQLNRWLFGAVDAEEKVLLSALADPQLLALARVNLDVARKLDSALGDVSELRNLPGQGADIWSSMERSGIHLSEQINQAYAVVFVDEAADTAVLARGNFEPEKLTRWLQERYGIDKQDDDGLWFTPVDQNNCAKEEPWLAIFTAQQILIGTPAAVKRISSRLRDKSAAAVNINHWQSSLPGQLASMVIFSPARWQEDRSGMLQYMTSKAAAVMDSVTAIYASVEPDLLMQAVDVKFSLVSDDVAYLKTTEQIAQKWLAESRQKAVQDWPEVGVVYDRLQLSNADNQLHARFRFDQKIKAELATWFASLFSFSASMNTDGGTVEEVIDESPTPFSSAQSTQLKPFTPYNDFTDAALQTLAGPFALGIESLTLEKEKLRLKLGVKAYDLPNLGKVSSGVELVITDVLGKQGQSLLIKPECGEKDQREATSIDYIYAANRYENNQTVDMRVLSGDKTIILPSNIAYSQVARIKGYINYHLPTSVETVTLKQPFAGQVVDLHGVRVRFKSTSESDLSYTYSGDVQRLLQINALNRSGQPLASSGSTSGDVFFGSGKYANVNFRGTVAAAQLIVAKTQEPLRYDFDLSALTPPTKEFFMAKPYPALTTTQDFAQISQMKAPIVTEFAFQKPLVTQTTGPAFFALDTIDAGKSFGLRIDGAIYTDMALPLAYRIGVAQLHIRKLVDKNGQQQDMDESVPLYFDHVGGMIFNGIYQPDEKTPWLKSNFSLRKDSVVMENVQTISGVLRFSLPNAVRTESVEFNLGQVWKSESASLLLTAWESGKLSFTLEGAVSELVSLRAFNAQGKLISQSPKYWIGFGKSELALEISEVPARLEVDYATEAEQLDFPFEWSMN